MIPGTGTALNCATILAGGTIGTLAGERIPERVREGLMSVLGVFTLVYGVKTALTASVGKAQPDLAVVLVGLLVGTVVGALLRIDDGLAALGRMVERRLSRGRETGGEEQASERSVSRALVTTSLLFCIGPLTILGSFEDGASGDILLLGIKAALDGVASLAFAATLGPGVLLSALTVLVVQGSLTGLAVLGRDSLDPNLVTQTLSAGGFLLILIGVGLLRIRRFAVADMLPALLATPLFAWLVALLHLPL